MDQIYLLTPLKTGGHNFKPADHHGAWVPMSGTLGELGAALDVDPKARVDVVRSTPDPWAQARSFADAVLHPTPLLAPLVAQWRGLLALFALKDHYQDVYTLTLTPVPLAAEGSRFAAVMARLLPQSALAAPADPIGHGWDRPQLVKLARVGADGNPLGEGQPIALLNPASLVAAGRDIERWHYDTIPWMRKGITDPTRLTGVDALPPAVLHLLAGFLGQLETGLERLCAGGTPDQQALLGTLRGQLQAYAKDCLAPLQRAGRTAASFDADPGTDWSAGLPRLYGLLARPLKARAPAIGTSDCLIRLRDDFDSTRPFEGLVLLDPAIATDDRPANQICFWGHKTLAQALTEGEGARRALRDEIAKAGYLLVEPKDFFTEVLVRLDDSEQPGRITAHPDSLQDCLLPLSPLALLLMKGDALPTQVSLSRDGMFSLRVTLSGGNHALGRRYVATPGDGQGRLLSKVDWGLGEFAIWPDFACEVWQHYCVRIDYSPNNLKRLRGRFAMSGRLLAERIRTAPTTEDRARLAAPWLDSRPIDNAGRAEQLDAIPEFAARSLDTPGLIRLRSRNADGAASEIQISTRAFEAAFFTILTEGGGRPLPAGMALLTLKALPGAGDKSGDVGIDFGTTNTVACLDDTKPLRLERRIVHPLIAAQPRIVAGGAAEFRDFLPLDERRLPTPTVIINRPLDMLARAVLDGDPRLDDALLMRHLIYFQPDFAADGSIAVIPIQAWTALLQNIKFNLKWSNTVEMRDAARRYLRQLMLMVSAEWTARGGNPYLLKWHFSRPEHMGDDKAFRTQLQNALVDIMPDGNRDAIRPLSSEGIAAANFILHENSQDKKTRGTINIILDIGGGTTDIAVWDNSATPKLCWSDSLRLAGGDFFTGHIMNNPELLDRFGLSAWSSVIAQLSKQTDVSLRDSVRFVGELLFSGDTLGNAIDKQWSRVSGTEDIARLKETAFVFLGGIAWYIGRQLRNLVGEGIFEAQALSDISVALCGRGSGLFVRLHDGDARADTEISRLLVLIAAAAGEARVSLPQVVVSPDPKIEVAAGMILAARRATPDISDRARPKASFDFEDAKQSAASDTAAHADEYLTFPLQTGIEDLDPFLRGLEKVVGLKVTLDNEKRAKLINGYAAVDREDTAAGRPLQSEFAVALKILVDLMRARPDAGVRPQTAWAGGSG